jgi:hypothetical protein
MYGGEDLSQILDWEMDVGKHRDKLYRLLRQFLRRIDSMLSE